MEQNLTRREARENAFLAAFSATFHPDDPQPVLLNQPESQWHGRRISPPKNENTGHRYKQLRNLSGRV